MEHHTKNTLHYTSSHSIPHKYLYPHCHPQGCPQKAWRLAMSFSEAKHNRKMQHAHLLMLFSPLNRKMLNTIRDHVSCKIAPAPLEDYPSFSSAKSETLAAPYHQEEVYNEGNRRGQFKTDPPCILVLLANGTGRTCGHELPPVCKILAFAKHVGSPIRPYNFHPS